MNKYEEWRNHQFINQISLSRFIFKSIFFGLKNQNNA